VWFRSGWGSRGRGYTHPVRYALKALTGNLTETRGQLMRVTCGIQFLMENKAVARIQEEFHTYITKERVGSGYG